MQKYLVDCCRLKEANIIDSLLQAFISRFQELSEQHKSITAPFFEADHRVSTSHELFAFFCLFHFLSNALHDLPLVAEDPQSPSLLLRILISALSSLINDSPFAVLDPRLLQTSLTQSIEMIISFAIRLTIASVPRNISSLSGNFVLSRENTMLLLKKINSSQLIQSCFQLQSVISVIDYFYQRQVGSLPNHIGCLIRWLSSVSREIVYFMPILGFSVRNAILFCSLGSRLVSILAIVLCRDSSD